MVVTSGHTMNIPWIPMRKYNNKNNKNNNNNKIQKVIIIIIFQINRLSNCLSVCLCLSSYLVIYFTIIKFNLFLINWFKTLQEASQYR